MANLNTLFDFSKYEKRKQPEQKEFEQSNRTLLIDFKNYVHLCFKKLHKVVLAAIEPVDQDKNLRAVVMSGYLAGQLKRHHPHLCYKATTQRFKLCIDGITNVYIKKLDAKTKLPSNIPTDESLLIINNLTETNADKSGNIFFGYVVDEAWSNILGIYALCIEGDNIIWISDLTNFGEDEQTAPVVTLTPKPKTPKVKPGAKKKGREKKKNE